MLVRLAIFWLGFASIAIAQQAQQNIQFVQPAKTIEEAIERQKAAEGAAAAKLAEAEATYSDEVDKANQQLIDDLRQLAKKAAANGDIADAAKAWEAILKIDARDKDAADFFRTINRAEVIAKAIAAAKDSNKKIVKLAWAHGGDPNKGGFFKDKDGLWSEIYGGKLQARFKEIGRSKHTLQLERVPPGVFVTIHDGMFYWSGKNHSDGLWHLGESGEWVK
jgi:tetratricopeptide (TPR) repeat protein